jgi:hypothetical protein
MHPVLHRALGNPVALPRDSEALAIIGGAGMLLGTAYVSYAVSPPSSPRPGAAAVVLGVLGSLSAWGAFKTNDSHPRMSTALGISAIFAGFSAVANLVVAAQLGQQSAVQPQAAPAT